MASQGTPSPPSPALTSQSPGTSVRHVVRESVIGQSSISFQPNIYHPHLYPQYYVPCGYGMQPIVQAASTPAGHPSSSAPIPTPVPSKRPRKAARKGRMRGSQNWSKLDLKALAHYVEGASHLRSDEWRQIEARYNYEYALPNGRQERRWDNMRDKWNSLKGMGKIPVVDSEDLPEVQGGTRRDGASGNNIDGADHTTPARETFVTSCPGTEPEWDGGSVGDGDSMAWQTKHGSASPSLAEMLLSSISPDAEARQDHNEVHNEVVMNLYLRRICAQEGTIRELELKNYALQDQLYSAVRKLNREERRADRFEMRLEMLDTIRTHRRRLSRRHRTHHQLTPSSSSGSNRSASSNNNPSSRPPSRSAFKSKRRRADLQADEEGESVFQEEEEEEEEEEARVT